MAFFCFLSFSPILPDAPAAGAAPASGPPSARTSASRAGGGQRLPPASASPVSRACEAPRQCGKASDATRAAAASWAAAVSRLQDKWLARRSRPPPPQYFCTQRTSGISKASSAAHFGPDAASHLVLGYFVLLSRIKRVCGVQQRFTLLPVVGAVAPVATPRSGPACDASG